MKQATLSKISKTIHGEGEVTGWHDRKLMFDYEADVIINGRGDSPEVEDVKNLFVSCFVDGEEVEPTLEESTLVVKFVEMMASSKAMENLSISDFENDGEEY